MRILFFENSEVWNHLLPVGFQDAGHEVKISGVINEQKILNDIQTFHPNMIITMGWGQFQGKIASKWIYKYAKRNKIPNIYWSLEDPGHTHSFVIPLIKNLCPDFIFTICKDRIDYFKKLGIKAAHMNYGYNQKIHFKENDSKYKCQIAVVANSYFDILQNKHLSYRLQSIQNLITPLIKENIRIDFWGNDWEKMKPIIGYEIPNDWIHGYLPYLKANKVYSSADIVLCLQNHYTQVTQRTYEILGCEGFMLAPDTIAIRSLFKPGKDLVVSASSHETLKLVKYYLNHPQKREKIQKQGNLAVKNHTYKNRAEYMIKILKEENILKRYI